MHAFAPACVHFRPRACYRLVSFCVHAFATACVYLRLRTCICIRVRVFVPASVIMPCSSCVHAFARARVRACMASVNRKLDCFCAFLSPALVLGWRRCARIQKNTLKNARRKPENLNRCATVKYSLTLLEKLGKFMHHKRQLSPTGKNDRSGVEKVWATPG